VIKGNSSVKSHVPAGAQNRAGTNLGEATRQSGGREQDGRSAYLQEGAVRAVLRGPEPRPNPFAGPDRSGPAGCVAGPDHRQSDRAQPTPQPRRLQAAKYGRSCNPPAGNICAPSEAPLKRLATVQTQCVAAAKLQRYSRSENFALECSWGSPARRRYPPHQVASGYLTAIRGRPRGGNHGRAGQVLDLPVAWSGRPSGSDGPGRCHQDGCP
jgi:hypothetical protein